MVLIEGGIKTTQNMLGYIKIKNVLCVKGYNQQSENKMEWEKILQIW